MPKPEHHDCTRLESAVAASVQSSLEKFVEPTEPLIVEVPPSMVWVISAASAGAMARPNAATTIALSPTRLVRTFMLILRSRVLENCRLRNL